MWKKTKKTSKKAQKYSPNSHFYPKTSFSIPYLYICRRSSYGLLKYIILLSLTGNGGKGEGILCLTNTKKPCHRVDDRASVK